MTLELNLGKVMGLFTPLWALLGVSLWVNWSDWIDRPWNLAWVVGPPFLFLALIGLVARRRWRLELTPTEMIHHTLGRTERYDFARMGPIEVKRAFLPEPLVVSTLWFNWPLGEAVGIEQAASQFLGRRVLAVFGDRSAGETASIIEDWRRAHGVSAAP